VYDRGAATEPEAVTAWARSGAILLTGWPGGEPLGPPAGLVGLIAAAGADIAARSAALGSRVELDWLALLGERAALAGLERAGRQSCGGGTRLLPAADGWVAVSLTRQDDVDLIPAWLGLGDVPADPWSSVAGALERAAADETVARAAWLGLPVGVLGEREPDPAGPVAVTEVGSGRPVGTLDGLVVVDLSALWAGPLCASILGLAGARVVKVESVARPDGGRQAAEGFFDLLNAGKSSVAVDLTTTAGRTALARLIEGADVVVESARPRALEQLGIVAVEELAADRGPRVWVSITGHGRSSERVGFGDDAAVAGGLVVEDGSGPCFCADAVADPVTGLVATAAALDALTSGSRCLLDVALAGVSADGAGPTLAVGGVSAAAPRARAPVGTARPFGADTAAVLASL